METSQCKELNEFIESGVVDELIERMSEKADQTALAFLKKDDIDLSRIYAKIGDKLSKIYRCVVEDLKGENDGN
jgi:hypothetical protein